MRYVIARKGKRPAHPRVAEQKAREEKMGLRRPETYAALRHNIERSRDQLMELLNGLRAQGKRVVGYAATSKKCRSRRAHIRTAASRSLRTRATTRKTARFPSQKRIW